MSAEQPLGAVQATNVQHQHLRTAGVDTTQRLLQINSDDNLVLTFVFWLCLILFVVLLAVIVCLIQQDTRSARRQALTRQQRQQQEDAAEPVDFGDLLKPTTVTVSAKDLIRRSSSCTLEREMSAALLLSAEFSLDRSSKASSVECVEHHPENESTTRV